MKTKQEMVMQTCPTQMCHASTILKLSNQDLLCAWFGGSKEGHDDVKIWMSRRVHGVWQKAIVVADEAVAHWNPVLFRLQDDEIMMFYKLGKEISRWQTMVVKSRDGGMTWSSPCEMVQGDYGGRGPVRNKPIRLSNGTILCPASREDGIWSAFVDASKDDGMTWLKKPEVVIRNVVGSKTSRTVAKVDSDIPVSEQSFYGRGVIQPTLWESQPGIVHMLLRSTEGKIYRSDSTDYGDTWTDAYPTELPNNNSGIDLVKASNGNLFLVYNPVGKNWGPRTPISLSVSKDNGLTWQKLLDLDGGEGEFAYPAIIAEEDTLYITYTWKRENIRFWQIEVK